MCTVSLAAWAAAREAVPGTRFHLSVPQILLPREHNEREQSACFRGYPLDNALRDPGWYTTSIASFPIGFISDGTTFDWGKTRGILGTIHPKRFSWTVGKCRSFCGCNRAKRRLSGRFLSRSLSRPFDRFIIVPDSFIVRHVIHRNSYWQT